MVRLILAPGASGDASSLRPHVDGLAARGFDAVAVDIPKGKAERAVSAYRDRAGQEGDVAIGGHSYGGRVASMVAAGPDATVRGLVLMSYPLHRPGQPEWEARTEHWTSITCPVLLLSGEADPFSRIDLLRRAVAERLPSAHLVTYPRVGHGLTRVLDQALDEVARFLRDLPPAR